MLPAASRTGIENSRIDDGRIRAVRIRDDLRDLVGDAAQEQVASLAADVGRGQPRTARRAPAAPTRCTGRPAPESCSRSRRRAAGTTRLFGLLMKLATHQRRIERKGQRGPDVIVVLMRSALDRLNLILGLPRADEDAEAARAAPSCRRRRRSPTTRGWKLFFFDL